LLLSGKFRAVSKTSRKPVCNLFNGYQVEEIMRVCVVSKATAQHFKRGTRLPSPQAQRLWWLHLHGRILGPDWDGFRVHRNELVDPDGLVYSAGEIASIPILHAQLADLRKQLDKVRYAESLGDLGFFEVTEALRGLLQDGATLLKAVEKIPRRSTCESRPRQDEVSDLA
jgi:hypothetical protein